MLWGITPRYRIELHLTSTVISSFRFCFCLSLSAFKQTFVLFGSAGSRSHPFYTCPRRVRRCLLSCDSSKEHRSHVATQPEPNLSQRRLITP